ncbi:maestro heat-like repeat-containing protein family member 6 [Colius striatus]|uniref:maestro heat-like repeat-containing protein family member 6 n=1 Tax=Colius striatus TaxID=57412 RepID=UPI002B1D3214|nr:maestro heat-like repeat-containing protein family member 6 [Colius striatus]
MSSLEGWDLPGEGQPSDVSAEPRVETTPEEPHDVVVTLLHRAPSCDREALTLWRQMLSNSRTADKTLQELLRVLQNWPWHHTSTADGNSIDVSVLAATRALQEILQMPEHLPGLRVHFPHFFLALLFQMLFTTEELPEEVDAFWQRVQQEGRLPSTPSRLAMETLKELLSYVGLEDEMREFERKHGWEALLNPETQLSAMGLLARELRGAWRGSRYEIARYIVELLSREQPRLELPAMAFLAELLACPDMWRYAERVLQLAPRYLRSESSVMRCLVLRALSILCHEPAMTKRMWILQRRLMELLGDADGEVVEMTLSLLRRMLWDINQPFFKSITLELAERLQPLFDHNNSRVQLLSLQLFQRLMEGANKKGRKKLKELVYQSLVQLLCILHDENQEVAEASRDTLLRAVHLLQKRKLSRLLERRQTWPAGECLLSESSSSRASQYVQQALWCLQSRKPSVQEAAVRFMGLAGQRLKGQQEELQVIREALQSMPGDISASLANLSTQTQLILTAVDGTASSRPRLLDRLHGAWRRRTSLWVSD